MKDGFIKVAAITPKVKVCDVEFNTGEIMKEMEKANSQGVKIGVFPELSITGYSCRDLFFQNTLLNEAKDALLALAEFTLHLDAMFFVGLPFMYHSKLYNVAAALSHGRVLGIIPKSYIPGYGEFYETRQFTPGMNATVLVQIGEDMVPMGRQLMFTCEDIPGLIVGAEICEDLWAPGPPSNNLVYSGATIICNLSASNEIIAKSEYRRELVKGQSGRLFCGYIYASAGMGESTQDTVYSGHRIIAENGGVLAEGELFSEDQTITEIDVQKIIAERRRMNTYTQIDREGFMQIPFYIDIEKTELSRKFASRPFVPEGKEQRTKRCEEIFNIQSYGLAKRLEHTHCKSAVIGVSGGLDSTQALLVTARAFEILGLDKKGIMAITMPGFGTTTRTKSNAVVLAEELGATVKEISIDEAVRVHFKDIGHDESVHDVTYENSQARERTQLLMDLANKYNGLVIGTGDLSELALGWATYNGDHMSMYAVNVGIPKTLIRYLVSYYAECVAEDEKLKGVLIDIIDTPVSPELLPPEDGNISQKTEELVGPYELHDFFLYYMMRFGYSPSKIYRMATLSFKGAFDSETILKWEKIFYRRFFNQQFKRSCLPDGPKVGTVSLSPRGDWRMPSDAVSSIWLRELEELEGNV